MGTKIINRGNWDFVVVVYSNFHIEMRGYPKKDYKHYGWGEPYGRNLMSDEFCIVIESLCSWILRKKSEKIEDKIERIINESLIDFSEYDKMILLEKNQRESILDRILD